MPLAVGDPAILPALSVILATFTGLLCFAASVLRLGFLADFLSRPILIGFLNGVAIATMLGVIVLDVLEGILVAGLVGFKVTQAMKSETSRDEHAE